MTLFDEDTDFNELDQFSKWMHDLSKLGEHYNNAMLGLKQQFDISTDPEEREGLVALMHSANRASMACVYGVVAMSMFKELTTAAEHDPAETMQGYVSDIKFLHLYREELHEIDREVEEDGN